MFGAPLYRKLYAICPPSLDQRPCEPGETNCRDVPSAFMTQTPTFSCAGLFAAMKKQSCLLSADQLGCEPKPMSRGSPPAASTRKMRSCSNPATVASKAICLPLRDQLGE